MTWEEIFETRCIKGHIGMGSDGRLRQWMCGAPRAEGNALYCIRHSFSENRAVDDRADRLACDAALALRTACRGAPVAPVQAPQAAPEPEDPAALRLRWLASQGYDTSLFGVRR